VNVIVLVARSITADARTTLNVAISVHIRSAKSFTVQRAL